MVVMDDLDVDGIDLLLQKAAKIRAEVGVHSGQTKQVKSSGSYLCQGCGQENSNYSSWCFECGLPKNQKKQPSCFLKRNPDKTSIPNYRVYNSEQILDEAENNPKFESKPREINTTRPDVKGDIQIFKYLEDSKPEPVLEVPSTVSLREMQIDNSSHSDISEPLEQPRDLSAFYSENDIILYTKGDIKKNKNKVIIKPLSTPNLAAAGGSTMAKPVKPRPTNCNKAHADISSFGPPKRPSRSQGRQAWQPPVNTGSIPAKREGSAGPQRNSASVPNKRGSSSVLLPQRRAESPAPAKRANSPAPARSKRLSSSAAISLTPTVFDRLYKNGGVKSRTRASTSSPNLITEERERVVCTSNVSLSVPHLRLSF